MATDDLDTTYCSCNKEGRGVELTPDGTYTCLLCHNEIFVNDLWSPRRFKVNSNIQKVNNLALKRGYQGVQNTNQDDLL
jgi:hypothetical protein